MGIKLVANDTVAPWYSKIIPPVTRGLEGWFTFDTDPSRFALNRAIGKPNAQLAGSPVAFSTHGRFKGLANFLQTDIAETEGQTIIVVGKAVKDVPASPAQSDMAFFAGNYLGPVVTPGYTGSAFGASLFFNAAGSMTGNGTRDNGSGAATSDSVILTGETQTSWAIRAMRSGPSGVASKAFNLTRGVSREGNSLASRVLASTKHRIGSPTSGFSGEVDISAVAFYSVALTDAEIAQVAIAMRRRMARLGISV